MPGVAQYDLAVPQETLVFSPHLGKDVLSPAVKGYFEDEVRQQNAC